MQSIKLLLLAILVGTLFFTSCNTDDEDLKPVECSVENPCKKSTQECKYYSLEAETGLCVDKTVCEDTNECDGRSCQDQDGTKYCVSTDNFTIKDLTLENAIIGEVYPEVTLEVEGANGEYYFKTVKGLPKGLTLSEEGKISGTPRGEAKDYEFTVVAINSKKKASSFYGVRSAEKNFVITLQKKDLCKDVTCGVNAECNALTGDCDCSQGFLRNVNTNLCEVETVCTQTQCSGHTECVDENGEGICLCMTGYQDNDSNGTCKPDCTNPAPTCETNMECSDASGLAKCVCSEGYAGETCMDCAEGFHAQIEDPTICENNVRVKTCTNEPIDVATWGDAFTDGKFTQEWNAETESFEPNIATDQCLWKCNGQNMKHDVENGLCVCPEGLVDDNNGGCKEVCADNQYLGDNGYCKCYEGYTNDPEEELAKCTKCADGYIVSGGICVINCTDNTKPNEAGNGCVCKEGFFGDDCTDPCLADDAESCADNKKCLAYENAGTVGTTCVCKDEFVENGENCDCPTNSELNDAGTSCVCVTDFVKDLDGSCVAECSLDELSMAEPTNSTFENASEIILTNGVASYENLTTQGTDCEKENDWYKVTLSLGQEITVDLIFIDADGDIDLKLFIGGDTYSNKVASSLTMTDNESVTYTIKESDIPDGEESVVLYIEATYGRNIYDMNISVVDPNITPECDPACSVEEHKVCGGTGTCVCDLEAGYVTNGHICVNMCSNVTCGDDAHCVATDALTAPTCECDDGFNKLGDSCVVPQEVVGANICDDDTAIPVIDHSGIWLGETTEDNTVLTCRSSATSKEVIYKLVLAEDSFVKVEEASSSFDAVLALKETCTAEEDLVCGDFLYKDSFEDFYKAGTYYLYVEAYSKLETDPYQLNVLINNPCTGDDVPTCGTNEVCEVVSLTETKCVCEDGFFFLNGNCVAPQENNGSNLCADAQEIIPGVFTGTTLNSTNDLVGCDATQTAGPGFGNDNFYKFTVDHEVLFSAILNTEGDIVWDPVLRLYKAGSEDVCTFVEDDSLFCKDQDLTITATGQAAEAIDFSVSTGKIYYASLEAGTYYVVVDGDTTEADVASSGAYTLQVNFGNACHVNTCNVDTQKCIAEGLGDDQYKCECDAEKGYYADADGNCVAPCDTVSCQDNSTCKATSLTDTSCECNESFFKDENDVCVNPCTADDAPSCSDADHLICVSTSATNAACECVENYESYNDVCLACSDEITDLGENSTRDTAALLTLTDAVTRFENLSTKAADCSNVEDWYKIEGLVAGDFLKVDLEFIDNLGDIDLKIYLTSTTYVANSGSISDNESASYRIKDTDIPAGETTVTAYIRVYIGKNVYNMVVSKGNPCTDPASCGANSECTPTSATDFTCTCDDGFFKNDAEECVNPCTDDSCGANSECVSTSATDFTCNCDDGFFKNDAEECVNPCLDNPMDCSATVNSICSPINATEMECVCETGYYESDNACIKNTGVDTCDDSDILTISESGVIVGTTIGMANDYSLSYGSCTGYTETGADVAYKVTLGVGDSINVNLHKTSGSGDISLYMVTDCADDTGSCVIGSDGSGDEDISFTATEAGDYFIIVDSYTSSAHYEYELTINATIAAPSTSLFFSEYIEGDGNNKALEIYNATTENVDLSEYYIIGASGDRETEIYTQLSGTLNAGEVFVTANPSSEQSILDQTDLEHAATNQFNGNDYRALAKVDANGAITIGSVTLTVIDQIGISGGTLNFNVADVEGATKNHTLIRKSSVTMGNGGDWATSAGTTADDSEWIVLPANSFDGLGSHSVD